MKRIKNLYFLMACLIIGAGAQGQRRLTEATISYDIVINTTNKTPQATDLLDGATSVIYLKGSSSRAEMISSLGTQATIIDGKTRQVTVLKSYGDQQYMITLTPENWKQMNKKYENVTYTFKEEYKVIAGYNCQKAIARLNDSTEFSIFFTRDLVPVNRDFQYPSRQLPGLAMQYEAGMGNLMVTYTVSSINFNPVPQTKFDLPKSGYRVMTYEESLGLRN